MTKDKQFKLRQPKIDKDLGCEEISYDGEWITYGEIVDILNKRKEDLNKRLYDLTEEGKLIEKKTGKIYNIKGFSALSLCYELNYLTTKIQELAKSIDDNEQLMRKKERYKRLYAFAHEQMDNRILTIKNFVEDCSDDEIKHELKKLLWTEVLDYDVSAKNRALIEENEQLKKENWELEQENEKLENRLWNCQNVR